MSIQQVTRAAVIIALLSFGSRILGFFREVIFAAFLGISLDMDSFLIAQTIPTTLGGMLYTSLVTAMIPLYSDALAKDGHDGAVLKAKLLFSMVLPLTLVSSALLYVAAPYAIAIIGHGLSAYGKDLAIVQMRLMLPCLVFFCLLAIANAFQQANHRFFFPYLGPLVFNIAVIGSFFACGSGIDTYEVSIIITVATLCQLLIQYPGMRALDLKMTFPKKICKLPGLRRDLVALLMPALLVTILNDIMPILDRLLAASLPEGGISAISYAHRVNAIFVSLIAGSITTATYPTIAAYLSRGDTAAVFDSLEQTIRLIAFATFPAIGLILLFPYELIEMLFMRGAFDAKAVLSTGSALYYLSFGIFGAGLIAVFGQYNCILRGNRFLVQTAAIIFACKIILSFYLIKTMSIDGLAVATSFSVIAGSIVFFRAWYLDCADKGFKFKTLAHKTTLIIIAAIIAMIAAKIAYLGLKYIVNDRWIILILSWVAGGCLYVVSAQRLGCEELVWFKKALMGRLGIGKGLS